MIWPPQTFSVEFGTWSGATCPEREPLLFSWPTTFGLARPTLRPIIDLKNCAAPACDSPSSLEISRECESKPRLGGATNRGGVLMAGRGQKCEAPGGKPGAS
jgi:hypothetical protein